MNLYSRSVLVLKIASFEVPGFLGCRTHSKNAYIFLTIGYVVSTFLSFFSPSKNGEMMIQFDLRAKYQVEVAQPPAATRWATTSYKWGYNML